LLAQRILVLTARWGPCAATEPDGRGFGGAALEAAMKISGADAAGCGSGIHRKYFEAGSDIVETNSFGGAPIVLGNTGGRGDAHFLNKRRPSCQASGDEFKRL